MKSRSGNIIKNRIDGDLAVGVDIGGTNIRAGLVNHQGEVIGSSISVPTGGDEDAESIIDRIGGSVSAILNTHTVSRSKILGIGMGVTGPLDIRNGLILECPQLPALHYYPLRARIRDIFQMPVWINNDANAMILGESMWGTGKGRHTVLGFTLGTGLGCAIVTDHKLLLGYRELSGEIWPSPYKEGTIEDYVSGSGISALYLKITGNRKSALEIGVLADQGNSDALAIWDEFGRALGFAMSWAINLLDPDIVVVGGSIANSFHLFERTMIDFVKKFSCPSPVDLPPLLKASLGDDAGLIGGAGLVFTDQ